MRRRHQHATVMTLAAILFFVLSPAAEARMAGGFGGGFSRMGPAGGGSFAARPFPSPGEPVDVDATRQAAVPARQDMPQDVPEARQDAMQARQDVRQEAPVARQAVRQDSPAATYQRHWDYWHDGATDTTEVAVGTVVAGDDLSADDCQVTIEGSDGFTYYDCNGTWYRKAFANGDVSYVVVDGPP